jgi:hypothetical protein
MFLQNFVKFPKFISSLKYYTLQLKYIVYITQDNQVWKLNPITKDDYNFFCYIHFSRQLCTFLVWIAKP